SSDVCSSDLLSAWLTTTASSRRTPNACSAGTTTDAPASKPPGCPGPMSYSSVCPAVRTSTDRPCPTSSTTSCTSPDDGSPRCGHSRGSQSSSASGFPGTSRGSISQNPPSSASGSANHAGSGNHQNAS